MTKLESLTVKREVLLKILFHSSIIPYHRNSRCSSSFIYLSIIIPQYLFILINFFFKELFKKNL